MTVGGGGHAAALLEAGVARVVGVDRDPEALAAASGRLADQGTRFRAVRARFSEVSEVVEEVDVVRAGGVLYDLGVSSMHLDRPERGFSYRSEGPLDMRMGPEGPTAADVVNTYPEEELTRVIRELEELAASLPRAAGLLEPGGRLVTISYHSLEDRIVKWFLAGDERLEVLTKKVVLPSPAEMARNPRAWSARLRAARRILQEAA